MKNKVKVVIAVVGLCLVLLPLGGCNQKASDFNMEEVVKTLKTNREKTVNLDNAKAVMEETGKIIKKYSDNKELEAIYLKGKEAVITRADIEQTIDFLMLKGGLDEESAIKEAVKRVTEREAIYEEAVANGFAATDDEVKAYHEELKQTMSKADNKDTIEAVIKAFGSEEKYWDYETKISKKDLPIIKYKKALEQQYKDKTVKLRKNLVEPTYEEGFENFFEKYMEALAKEENYQLVK